MKLFYADKKDPRIFIYKSPKYKCFGVTLNFAHGKSWLISLVTLLPLSVFIEFTEFVKHADITVFGIIFALFMSIYMVSVIVYYF